MKRVLLGLLVGAVVAIPAGYAFGSGQEVDPQVPTVAASECPDAVAAIEAAGNEVPDTFSPDCPDPASITPDESEIPVDDLASDCDTFYAANDQPAWCPTAAEITAAEGSE